MSPTFACDVSYYQCYVDDSYPHRWLIFRACDGEFRDPKFDGNIKWARGAVKSGQIEGFTVYAVFEPGVDVLSIVKDMVGNPGKHCTFMLDIERWGGKITGDHSKEINKILRDAAKWLGSKDRVLAYANQGDFAVLYPKRNNWCHFVVASYSSLAPHFPRMIGWQYSDGTSNWPVPDDYPRSSAPFGNCDHNVFPNLTPEQLAEALGVGGTKDESEELYMNNKERQALIDDIAKAVVSQALPVDDNKDATVGSILRGIRGNVLAVRHEVQSHGNKLDSIAQIVGAAKTGVLARVASLQKAVSGIKDPVANVDASAIAKAVAAEVGTSAKTADAVIAKFKQLTLGVK